MLLRVLTVAGHIEQAHLVIAILAELAEERLGPVVDCLHAMINTKLGSRAFGLNQN